VCAQHFGPRAQCDFWQEANAKLNSQEGTKRQKGGKGVERRGKDHAGVIISRFCQNERTKAKIHMYMCICKRRVRANKRMCCILSSATPWNFAKKLLHKQK